MGRRQVYVTSWWALGGLGAAALVAAAGLAGWARPAWVAATLVLAVLGVRALAGRAPVPPAAPYAPGPVAAAPAEPLPDPALDQLTAATARLEAALAEVRERATGPELDRHFNECADRLADTFAAMSTFASTITDSSGRLDILRSVMFQILGQISELNDISDRISAMVGVIRRIASQTNLLALNATIEAARAGDAGRSFAVVAGEVRKLAEDSRAATESIDQIVTEVRDLSEATIEVASSASEEVESAKEQVTTLDDGMGGLLSDLERVRACVDAARIATQDLTAAITGEPTSAVGSGA
jgi:methyl-accepting chemotaxis protein